MFCSNWPGAPREQTMEYDTIYVRHSMIDKPSKADSLTLAQSFSTLHVPPVNLTHRSLPVPSMLATAARAITLVNRRQNMKNRREHTYRCKISPHIPFHQLPPRWSSYLAQNLSPSIRALIGLIVCSSPSLNAHPTIPNREFPLLPAL